MDTKQQWNDAGFCYRNAEVLRKVGMPYAAAYWQERGEVLMAQLCGKPSVSDIFEHILRTQTAGRA